jgi:hypothetical protein
LLAAGTVSVSAEQVYRERREPGVIVKAIRVVRSIFKPQTNSDIVIPPLPAPTPHP